METNLEFYEYLANKAGDFKFHNEIAVRLERKTNINISLYVYGSEHAYYAGDVVIGTHYDEHNSSWGNLDPKFLDYVSTPKSKEVIQSVLDTPKKITMGYLMELLLATEKCRVVSKNYW